MTTAPASAFPDPPTPDPADMAAYLADLSARIQALEAEAQHVRQWLAERLPDGTHSLRGLSVTVYAPRRFDPSRAMRIIPPHLLPQVLTSTVDRVRAQRVLTEEQYRECQSEGKRTVRIA